ncbi:MAG: hypothetical protein KGD70_13940, partial [Candidatus Lokiarchaeota archaeon]|nr:hypothetical protein [Candidatus Lokiarchaeota archaeon]
TTTNGSFNFTYKPEIIGDWIITANWESQKSYYTSAKNNPIDISIESQTELGLSSESVFIFIITIIVLVAVIGSILIFFKHKKKP